MALVKLQGPEEQLKNQLALINKVYYVLGKKYELQKKVLLSGHGLL